jgi:superfamily II DNA or RNA helicase
MFSAFKYQEVASKLLRETSKNILVIAPTGAGKTRVGVEALALAGKGCYVAPTRALCYEKFKELRANFPRKAIVLGNKDYSLWGRDFACSDFRVLTPFRLNHLLSSVKDFPRLSPVVVIDEIHNLDPDVEIILTKLMLLHPDVRIIGLSATIHEDDEPKLANWLNALVVKGKERPVPLVERVVRFDPDLDRAGREITNVTVLEGGRQADSWMVNGEVAVWRCDHLKEIYSRIRGDGDAAPILIWTPYRERANKIARAMAEMLRNRGKRPDPALRAVADSLPSGAHTPALKSALPYGVGVHHGGLTQRERELVYELARDGKLEIIVTCMTLAQGVNLPARHVVFDTVHEYDESGRKRLIDVSVFRQIQGRAGRPQYDNIGYCWIPVFTEVELVEVEEILLKHKASPLVSRIYNEFFLTSQIPGLILLGFGTPERLAEFIRATLWGQALRDIQPLVDQMARIVSYIIERGAAEVRGGRLILTRKGWTMARLGLHPAEHEAIERLASSGCLDYEEWVRTLARIRIDNDPSSGFQEGDVDPIVEYGLAVHAAPKSTYKIRELADYVQRMIDLSEALLAISGYDRSYRERWRRGVSAKFTYGKLVLMEHLAPALGRDQIKRLVRNLGGALTKSPEDLSREELLEIARLLYGHRRSFRLDKQSRAVANALGISPERLVGLVREAQEKASLPTEVGDDDAG